MPNPQRGRAGTPAARRNATVSRLKAWQRARHGSPGAAPRRVDGSRRPGHCKEAGGVAFVDRVRLFRRQLDAVERLGDEVVDQQSLHDVHDLADVAGREVAVGEDGEAARCGVEVERLLIHAQCSHGDRRSVVEAADACEPVGVPFWKRRPARRLPADWTGLMRTFASVSGNTSTRTNGSSSAS